MAVAHNLKYKWIRLKYYEKRPPSQEISDNRPRGSNKKLDAESVHIVFHGQKDPEPEPGRPDLADGIQIFIFKVTIILRHPMKNARRSSSGIGAISKA